MRACACACARTLQGELNEKVLWDILNMRSLILNMRSLLPASCLLELLKLVACVCVCVLQVKELSDKLDTTLADLDHSNTAKEDMRRRHEALIDDREGVERDHQAQVLIRCVWNVY